MTEVTAITVVERTELIETERPIPFEAAFSVWLASLIDQSNRTKEIYSRSVGDFIEWLEARGLQGVNQIVIANLMAYRAKCQEKLDAGEYKRSTVANRLVAVHRFLTHCAVEGFLRQGITRARIQTYLKNPKQGDTRLPVYLEKDEISRLIRAATNKRDKALLVLALGGGLRVSELVNLKVGDLKPQKDGGAILEIRNGKGNKSRSFRIPKKVVTPIRAYLRESGRSFRRRADLETRLFDSFRQNGKLTRGRVNQILAECIKWAKIDKPVTPHTLRHTFATHFCIGGGNPVALAEILRHANLDTTMIYVHLARMITEGSYEADWL